jgi:isopentenyl-diphosphate Delta-isomerase
VMTDEVIVVDGDDRPVGRCPKLDAHRDGVLHRAFSVAVFRRGMVLLQRRASTKYHFASRWSNACCSHPAPGEGVHTAARRRLRQELGLDMSLRHCGTFRYRSVDPESGLVEHEIDHVLVGWTDLDPRPAPSEIDAVRWMPLRHLDQLIQSTPTAFTPWMATVHRMAGAAVEP